MGMGFGISSEDIQAVAQRRGVELDEDQAEEWLWKINHDLVEAAALQADDMDEQTELALQAIDSQLDELGYWDPRKAELAASALEQSTVQAPGQRAKRI